MNMFRTVQGKRIELTEYIREYIKNHPSVQIIVGCDSQNYSKDTVYVTAVTLPSFCDKLSITIVGVAFAITNGNITSAVVPSSQA